MTKELERAAEEASAELHMGVELSDVMYSTGLWRSFEITPPLDNADPQPIYSPSFKTDAAALAYLEGLAQGAQIQRVRHAPLVELVAALGRTVAAGNGDEVVPVEIGLRIIALRNALAELEA